VFAPTALALLGVAGLLTVVDYRLVLSAAAALGIAVAGYCAAGRGERGPEVSTPAETEDADARHG
jgi:hypothetical protein